MAVSEQLKALVDQMPDPDGRGMFCENIDKEKIETALAAIARGGRDNIRGLIEMLGQPEFAEVNRVRQVLEMLQGGKGLGPLIPRALASNGVQVVIGGEHSRDEMREYSVVLSRYGIADQVVGVLGVIGPTRMAYPRTISTVRYISTVMSDLLGDLYGNDGSRS